MYGDGELQDLISKFDNRKISGLSVKEQTEIYNFLKELQFYRRIGTINDCLELKFEKRENTLLNPIGEYACKFAENHGISISEALKHGTVKAFANCYNSGMMKDAT